ncbi:MAG: hypothetical protein EU535_07580, partial [Promethearchaeota archaeon]
MTKEKLKQILSLKYDPKIVGFLVSEFVKMRENYWLGDSEKTLIKGARYAELCIALLKQSTQPKKEIDLNKINFEQYYLFLINLPKKDSMDELLYLVIPNVLKGLYSIRNKKDGMHFKLSTLYFVDSEYVVNASSWILSQLLLTISEDENEIETIVESVIK